MLLTGGAEDEQQKPSYRVLVKNSVAIWVCSSVWSEHLTVNQGVEGSNPSIPAKSGGVGSSPALLVGNSCRKLIGTAPLRISFTLLREIWD